ncbi:type I restriction-modification system subunit M [Candidatus Accumulibacter propinquus]|uniref:type I restriction-modification system subunit M n=1 Tax=Candidatus Accumulibacter propinquus TaxID=2954380 RepID=UPI003DA9C43E
MDQSTHHKIVSFIWGIADDVLRDLFKRGKYPDVILPMCVIRRMEAVLEPTKQKLLDTRRMLDAAGITEQHAALCDAAGQAFYNTSRFTLRDLRSRGSQQRLLADFEDYLNGFSANVQDILDNFKFRNQLPTLSRADAIGSLINKATPRPTPSARPTCCSRAKARAPSTSSAVPSGPRWRTTPSPPEFDFMLANPPYGKSWKKDLEAMGGKDGMRDPRFRVMHQGEELSLVTRSSDGQMLFARPARQHGVEDERRQSALGSRITEVHNGSSLFTGDAGQGESNIRRWLIENDWLEAIVALPLNLFYNTGIATYIWVLSNRKPAHRQGRVQLIDASQWFKPLRKNLGKKNCELSPEDIERISRCFLDFQETPESKIFANAAFGYWKVTVERPLRLHSQLSLKAIETLRFNSGDEDLRATLVDEFGDDLCIRFAAVSAALEKRLADWGSSDDPEGEDDEGATKRGLPERQKKKLLDARTWERDGRLVDVATRLRALLGDALFDDHNVFRDRVDAALKAAGIKLAAADLKQLLRAVSWRVDTAAPVIARVHKPGKVRAEPLRGRYAVSVDGRPAIVEYEPDADLRDTEQVPLLEDGGIEAFIRREVLPYTPDAWIRDDATRIGYEISFTRHFYQPQPLRTLEEISADILAIEKEAEGLLDGLLKVGRR